MKPGDLVRLRRKPRNEPSERLVGLVLEEVPWPESFKKNSAVERRFKVMFSGITEHLVLEESGLEVIDEAR